MLFPWEDTIHADAAAAGGVLDVFAAAAAAAAAVCLLPVPVAAAAAAVCLLPVPAAAAVAAVCLLLVPAAAAAAAVCLLPVLAAAAAAAAAVSLFSVPTVVGVAAAVLCLSPLLAAAAAAAAVSLFSVLAVAAAASATVASVSAAADAAAEPLFSVPAAAAAAAVRLLLVHTAAAAAAAAAAAVCLFHVTVAAASAATAVSLLPVSAASAAATSAAVADAATAAAAAAAWCLLPDGTPPSALCASQHGARLWLGTGRQHNKEDSLLDRTAPTLHPTSPTPPPLQHHTIVHTSRCHSQTQGFPPLSGVFHPGGTGSEIPHPPDTEPYVPPSPNPSDGPLAEEGTCRQLSEAQELHRRPPDRVPDPPSHRQHGHAAGALWVDCHPPGEACHPGGDARADVGHRTTSTPPPSHPPHPVLTSLPGLLARGQACHARTGSPHPI